jgi:hypothetical protein
MSNVINVNNPYEISRIVSEDASKVSAYRLWREYDLNEDGWITRDEFVFVDSIDNPELNLDDKFDVSNARFDYLKNLFAGEANCKRLINAAKDPFVNEMAPELINMCEGPDLGAAAIAMIESGKIGCSNHAGAGVNERVFRVFDAVPLSQREPLARWGFTKSGQRCNQDAFASLLTELPTDVKRAVILEALVADLPYSAQVEGALFKEILSLPKKDWPDVAEKILKINAYGFSGCVKEMDNAVPFEFAFLPDLSPEAKFYLFSGLIDYNCKKYPEIVGNTPRDEKTNMAMVLGALHSASMTGYGYKEHADMWVKNFMAIAGVDLAKVEEYLKDVSLTDKGNIFLNGLGIIVDDYRYEDMKRYLTELEGRMVRDAAGESATEEKEERSSGWGCSLSL